MTSPAARRRTKKLVSGRRFIQLFSNVKRSEAYHGLGPLARAMLIEILDRYTGINNGMIAMSCRDGADALRCSRGAAANALRELDDAGLVRPVTGGVWRGKRATEWRLTFYRCDKTGELPVTSWKEHAKCPPGWTQDASKVHRGGRKQAKCPSGRTHRRNSSMNGSAKCPPGWTNIDIYHEHETDECREAEDLSHEGDDAID
jgi:hypothetical protein